MLINYFLKLTPTSGNGRIKQPLYIYVYTRLRYLHPCNGKTKLMSLTEIRRTQVVILHGEE